MKSSDGLLRSSDGDEFDVAIIGGGIIGCATALNLSRAGLRVCVFERQTIASEQSSRAWGFIRQQGRHPAELPLAQEALELWGEFAETKEGKSTELTVGGILMPAETEADEERLANNNRLALGAGIAVEQIGPRRIRELIPELAGRWRSGLYSRSDAHADPGLSSHAIGMPLAWQGLN